jgi:nitrogen fixation/metabolism regulation signal transduction histidine kinase
MAAGRRIVKIALVPLSLLALALWVIALLLFSQIIEDSEDFAAYSTPILLINAVGVTVMLVLIGSRLFRLIRDYRRFIPGSRLEARFVGLIVLIGTVPLIVFYMFSVLLIGRGLDEWFQVDVSGGLENTLKLGRATVDLTEEFSLNKLRNIADRLVLVDPEDRSRELGKLWSGADAREVVLYSSDGTLRAAYSRDSAGILPTSNLEESILMHLRQPLPQLDGQPQPDPARMPSFVETVILEDSSHEIRAAVRVPQAGGDFQILYAKFPVPTNIYELINSVENTQAGFSKLDIVRSSLELVFSLALSLVLLAAILAAVYAAFFAARRLVSPIQQLMQGTRAVARGDFNTKVPLAQRDEIGFLVNSFNDMTQRLALARRETRDSEKRLEDERNTLEVILARLSTGVVSLGADLKIRTANKAAGDILGVDLEAHIGESLVELAESRPLLKEFLNVSAEHLAQGRSEWREQITLHGELGNRELVCACTDLPSDGEHGQGYIIVFDDITVLMQAQREAAWGEVARRLAHEIKNPLTPIQLSAERVRRRYLADGGQDLDLLDRATHTIIQQVDAMKGMVDAFSEYARAPDIELSLVDLNALIGEVTELYRHQVSPVMIRLNLDQTLPKIEADIGRLRQVMHNLMRNASEAVEGKPDAEIGISTKRRELKEGPFAEIVVSDNGPGFASDIVDQAFLPYVTSKAKGTGLGLAIVRKLVEEHGGRIHAGNKAQGGAEVGILLPLPGVEGSTHAVWRAQHIRRRA